LAIFGITTSTITFPRLGILQNETEYNEVDDLPIAPKYVTPHTWKVPWQVLKACKMGHINTIFG